MQQISNSGLILSSTPSVLITNLKGSSETSYDIKVSGTGSITGLDYTIPAHSTGLVIAKLDIKSMTTQDVKDLNALAMGMLDASQRDKVEEIEKTHASADLSMWSMFFGGGGASASYDKTRKEMHTKGLTDQQIDKLIDAFMDVATNMSTVEININVDNSKNDYSVSGNIYLYTISGSVSSGKETSEYRMLAKKGTADTNPSGPTGDGAPAEGNIVPLN